jgi:hypothetical protein
MLQLVEDAFLDLTIRDGRLLMGRRHEHTKRLDEIRSAEKPDEFAIAHHG